MGLEKLMNWICERLLCFWGVCDLIENGWRSRSLEMDLDLVLGDADFH